MRRHPELCRIHAPPGRATHHGVSAAALLCGVLGGVLAGLPGPLPAQAMRYGVVMDPVRETLAGAWNTDPRQVERAYGVTEWWAAVPRQSRAIAATPDTEDAPGDTVFRVIAVEPQDARGPRGPVRDHSVRSASVRVLLSRGVHCATHRRGQRTNADSRSLRPAQRPGGSPRKTIGEGRSLNSAVDSEVDSRYHRAMPIAPFHRLPS
jgi:hypothetical protein